MRILFVDDSRLMRESVKASLEALGAEVFVAEDIIEAHRILLQEGSFDFALVDHILTSHGNDAFNGENLQPYLENLKIPFAFLTADKEWKVFAAPIWHKPLMGKELLSKIKSYVKGLKHEQVVRAGDDDLEQGLGIPPASERMEHREAGGVRGEEELRGGEKSGV